MRADGSPLVAWQVYSNAASETCLLFHMFDSAGNPVFAPGFAHADLSDERPRPASAGLSDGGFVIFRAGDDGPARLPAGPRFEAADGKIDTCGKVGAGPMGAGDSLFCARGRASVRRSLPMPPGRRMRRGAGQSTRRTRSWLPGPRLVSNTLRSATRSLSLRLP